MTKFAVQCTGGMDSLLINRAGSIVQLYRNVYILSPPSHCYPELITVDCRSNRERQNYKDFRRQYEKISLQPGEWENISYKVHKKAPIIKEKIRKWDFIIIKNLCLEKDNVKELKRQATD